MLNRTCSIRYVCITFFLNTHDTRKLLAIVVLVVVNLLSFLCKKFCMHISITILSHSHLFNKKIAWVTGPDPGRRVANKWGGGV
jgi:hypothetical protein